MEEGSVEQPEQSQPPKQKEETQSQQQKGPQIDGPFSISDIKPEMTSKESYFELLRAWVNQANMSQNAMACFPYYLMANYPQMFQTSQTQATILGGLGAGIMGPGINQPNQNFIGQNFPIGNGGIRGGDRRLADYFDNDLRQEEIINQNGGYEFVIAPFWKRFLAELIDVALLLLLKLMLTFMIVDFFDLDLGIGFDLDALKKSIEDDYTEFLSFSSDLILLEILTKIAVCFYEALWTMSGHGYVGGATPGKIFVGIRIVYVEAVLPLQPAQPALNGAPLRALLFPASNPGLQRALFRAMAKNILMVLLFPMCFIMLFFKNNRTAYDVMTKTIVVEENHAPILRRR